MLRRKWLNFLSFFKTFHTQLCPVVKTWIITVWPQTGHSLMWWEKKKEMSTPNKGSDARRDLPCLQSSDQSRTWGQGWSHRSDRWRWRTATAHLGHPGAPAPPWSEFSGDSSEFSCCQTESLVQVGETNQGRGSSFCSKTQIQIVSSLFTWRNPQLCPKL